MCYVDHNEPRQNSVAIFLKDVEKPEFYVRRATCNGSAVVTDSNPGRLLKVFAKDYPLPEAPEAAVAWCFGASKPIGLIRIYSAAT